MDIIQPVLLDIKNKDYSSALSKLNQIIKRNKNLFFEYNFLKADILIKLENYKEAKKEFQEGIKAQKLPERCLLGLGIIEEINHQYAQAYNYYIKSIREKPTPEAYNQLGSLYQRGLGVVRNGKKAKHYYEFGISLDRKYTLCSINKGILEQEEGDYRESIKSFLIPFMINEHDFNLNPKNKDYGIVIKRICDSINVIAIKENNLDKVFRDILDQALKIDELKKSDEKILDIKRIQEAISISQRQTIKMLISKGYTNKKLLTTGIGIEFSEVKNLLNLDLSSPELILYNEDFLKILNSVIFTKGLKYRCTDLATESFFTSVRKLILKESISNINRINNEEKLNIIIRTISKQCFENEFIWATSKDEEKEISKLYDLVFKKFKKGEIVSNNEIYILSSYKRLGEYSKIQKFLKKINEGDTLFETTKLQVLDFELEKKIGNQVTSIEKIEDKVSLNVQSQYEENPYPRWAKEEFEILKLDIYKRDYREIINNSIMPNTINIKKEIKKILIAGCGTGSHPVSIALRDKKTIIDALDISKASLSYGIRQARELNIKNINWYHGDILKFDSFDQEYDAIESSGVLHHTGDPKKGFKILTNKLRKGGFFKLGLYSRIYRNQLKPAKKFIKEHSDETKSLDSQVRMVRKKIIDLKGSGPENLPLIMRDFYSTSEFIDLLMHVQEIDYSIDELIELFEENYNFLGFVFGGSEEKLNYRSKFPNDLKMLNLNNWKNYEKNEPKLFSSMYQFWLQKN